MLAWFCSGLNSFYCLTVCLPLCNRWRGTPETPSSASCTQRCPSPAPRIFQCPAPPPLLATLRRQPPPTRCGTSPNPSFPPSKSLNPDKHETIKEKKKNEAKILLCFLFFIVNSTHWAFFLKLVLKGLCFLCLCAFVGLKTRAADMTVKVPDQRSCCDRIQNSNNNNNNNNDSQNRTLINGLIIQHFQVNGNYGFKGTVFPEIIHFKYLMDKAWTVSSETWRTFFFIIMWNESGVTFKRYDEVTLRGPVCNIQRDLFRMKWDRNHRGFTLTLQYALWPLDAAKSYTLGL